MQKQMLYLILALIVRRACSDAACDAACDEPTLIAQLKQDIRDNGKLDCLRAVQNPLANVEETETMKKNRIAAS